MTTIQQVQEVLGALLSPDTNTIKQAELFLSDLKKQNVTQLVQFFVQGLQLQDKNAQELSAVLLRKQCLQNSEDLKQISNENLQELSQVCKQLLNNQKTLVFMKRIAEIIVQINTFIDNYDEMIQIMVTLDQVHDETNKMQLLSLYFVEILSEFSLDDEQLMKYSQHFTAIFEKNLIKNDLIVKVAAMRSMTIFLSSINEEGFLKKFQNVFPILIQTSIEAIKADNEEGALTLESLSELLETHPKFIKPYIPQFLMLLTEIIDASNLSEKCRSASLNCLVILSTTNPVILRKSDLFLQKSLPGVFKMLTELDQSVDFQEWNDDLLDQSISKNDPSSLASDTLAKITPEIGVKSILPVLVPYIQQYIVQSQWQNKYAALIGISMVCEGANQHFANQLDGIMGLVIGAAQNEQNPRVIYGVLTAYALLCSEFFPQIQNKYHNQILPYFVQQMNNNSSLKVQYRAVSSICNFFRDIVNDDCKDICLPYIGSLLGCISSLFQKGLNIQCFPLLEEVLNALSMIAVVSEEFFSQYYDQFMPGLKQILLNYPTDSPQQVNIRILTIECIGFMATAVEKNQDKRFQDDLNQIMATLVSIQNHPNLPKDDPHHSAILSVYSCLAQSMQERFLPYMDAIFSKIIDAVNIKVDFFMQDKDDEQMQNLDPKQFHKQQIDLKMFGGIKTLALNTHALEQKIAGSAALQAISCSLKKSFYPYAQISAQSVGQLISYTHSKVKI